MPKGYKYCKQCGASSAKVKFSPRRAICIDCQREKAREEAHMRYEAQKRRNRTIRNGELDRLAAIANERGITYGQLQCEEYWKKEREERERMKRRGIYEQT